MDEPTADRHTDRSNDPQTELQLAQKGGRVINRLDAPTGKRSMFLPIRVKGQVKGQAD